MSTLANAIMRGTHASRPTDNSAGTEGRLYYETDTNILFRDNGTSWDNIEAAGATQAFVQLAQTVLSGTAATFDFTSISGSYNHLKLFVQARGDTAAGETDIHMTLNNDTGNNYDIEFVQGINTTASASNVVAGAQNYIGHMPANTATANFAGCLEIVIFNYARTTFFKSYNGVSGSIATAAANATTRVSVGQWRSTSAVTRVTLTPGAGNFQIGSVATLYGLL